MNPQLNAIVLYLQWHFLCRLYNIFILKQPPWLFCFLLIELSVIHHLIQWFLTSDDGSLCLLLIWEVEQTKPGLVSHDEANFFLIFLAILGRSITDIYFSDFLMTWRLYCHLVLNVEWNQIRNILFHRIIDWIHVKYHGMWLLLTHNTPWRGKFLMVFLIWFTLTADMNFSVSVTLYYFNFSAFSLSLTICYMKSKVNIRIDSIQPKLFLNCFPVNVLVTLISHWIQFTNKLVYGEYGRSQTKTI